MSDNQEERGMQARDSYEPDFAKRVPVVHELGTALTIDEVAELLGCSPWTVRQRYLRQGLPHLRACASGKLVFFREQVVGWILKRQQQRQKGGTLR